MCSTAPCSASSRSPASRNIGQKLLRLEVHDPPEARHQMRAGRANPEERKILKIYKGFRGWMGVEVALAHDRQVIGADFFGAARQHDPRALQRIALGPLVQHQRNPGIGRGYSWYAAPAAKSAGSASHRHGWRHSPASNRDRRFQPSGSPKPLAGCAGAAIGPACRRRNQRWAASIISGHLIAIRDFSRPNGYLYELEPTYNRRRFAELGHTSAQLALLVDRVRSPFIGASLDCPPFQPHSF